MFERSLPDGFNSCQQKYTKKVQLIYFYDYNQYLTDTKKAARSRLSVVHDP